MILRGGPHAWQGWALGSWEGCPWGMVPPSCHTSPSSGFRAQLLRGKPLHTSSKTNPTVPHMWPPAGTHPHPHTPVYAY